MFWISFFLVNILFNDDCLKTLFDTQSELEELNFYTRREENKPIIISLKVKRYVLIYLIKKLRLRRCKILLVQNKLILRN